MLRNIVRRGELSPTTRPHFTWLPWTVLYLLALKVEGGRRDVPVNNYLELEVSEFINSLTILVRIAFILCLTSTRSPVRLADWADGLASNPCLDDLEVRRESH